MRVLLDKNSQRSFIKSYWREGRKALLKSVQPVLARAEHINPEDLKQQVRRLLIKSEIEGYIETLYLHTGSHFAYSTAQKLLTKKDDYQLNFWERLYKKYAAERSAKVTGQILDTEAENINRIIDLHISSGEAAGLGVQDIANYMRANLESDLVNMQYYEAERIARTEVIGASNTASLEGAKSTGLDIGKFWMHSGILSPGYRVEHVMFQDMGVQDIDYEYDTGLQCPGDENADPGQIINCRCTIGYDDKN